MKKLFGIIALCVFAWLLAGCASSMDSVSGAITQIEQGKDGKQITIITDDDVVYTTAVSMTDTVVNGTLDDLVVWVVVSVSVDEMADSLIMWDTVEIIN